MAGVWVVGERAMLFSGSSREQAGIFCSELACVSMTGSGGVMTAMREPRLC